MDAVKLAEKIISGKRLGRGDDLDFLLTAELRELCLGADMIRRALCGEEYHLCSIINGKSGACSENCRFCAQSCRYETPAETYGFLPEEEIVNAAVDNYSRGVERFSIVTAGRRLAGDDFRRSISAFRAIREKCGIGLCASHGLLTAEQLRELKEAGVTRYHCNIETSRRNFPNICTTHTFDEKIECLKAAAAQGLELCSGIIIGMGENWEDRLDCAVTLAEIGVRSVPLNVLNPIKGTPLAELKPPSEDEILRVIAVFRYIIPEAEIRLAGGRKALSDNGRGAFLSGAAGAITGDMLTTAGNGIDSDIEMLEEILMSQ